MNSNYVDSLRQNFEHMHSEMLIQRKLFGGLTEEALKVIDEEIAKRGISQSEIDSFYQSSSDSSFSANYFPKGIGINDLAPISKRYIAQGIDQIFGVSIWISIQLLLGNSNTSGVLGLLTYVAYIALNDAMPNGQSIGKKLFKIKVVSAETGKSCNIKESLKRNVTTCIPVVCLIDGLMIFDSRRQRLGDKWAKTLVVKTKPT